MRSSTYRALALVACALAIAFPVSAGESVTKILSYEAPTVEAHVTGSWTRGPYASGPDATGVTPDDRVDAGRLFTLVPAGTTELELTVADSVMPFTPVRFEWFKADGATAGGAGAVCAPQFAPLDVPAPADAAFLVLWVHAASAGGAGVCPLDAAPAGATAGDVVLTFAS